MDSRRRCPRQRLGAAPALLPFLALLLEGSAEKLGELEPPPWPALLLVEVSPRLGKLECCCCLLWRGDGARLRREGPREKDAAQREEAFPVCVRSTGEKKRACLRIVV